MYRTNVSLFALLAILLSACTKSAHSAPWLGTSSPAQPVSVLEGGATPNPYEPLHRALGQPILTPTPDSPHNLPGLRVGAQQYTVKSGDTLFSIAQRFNILPELITQASQLQNPNAL